MNAATRKKPSKSARANASAELTLADEAYATLTEEIVCLDIAPGSVVSEWSLSERLDIGRTPIREAIKRLVRDYLVTLVPYRGIMVSPISVIDMLLMLEPRRALEPLRYARAAKRSNPADREEFSSLANKLDEAAAAFDIHGHTRIDKVFDTLVDRCAANQYLTDAVTPLHNNVRRFWNAQTESGGFKEITSWHSALVRAVATGDPEAASKACMSMLDFNARFFKERHDYDI